MERATCFSSKLGRGISALMPRPFPASVCCVLKADGQDRDVILFKTLKDIKVGTELKFNQVPPRRGPGLNG